MNATGRRLSTLALALFCLALTVFFFSPRFWILAERTPGSFEWDRGISYMRQCAGPFASDLEPAMRWRLLPPLTARVLGLHDGGVLLLPWLGVAAFAWFVAARLRRERDDWRFVVGGTLLLTTSSACLVPIGWLGLNDAWVWLGLCVVAFSSRSLPLVLSCLLCPWVDERFIIGFPLAFLVRLEVQSAWSGGWRALVPCLWLLPYAAARLSLGRVLGFPPADSSFLANCLRLFPQELPFLPLGLWMAWRAGWASVVFALLELDWRRRWLLGAAAAGTVLVSAFLAADLSRSMAILAPLVLLGILRFSARHPALAARVLGWAGVVALLIPAVHVVLNKLMPIDSLPIEVLRYWRLR